MKSLLMGTELQEGVDLKRCVGPASRRRGGEERVEPPANSLHEITGSVEPWLRPGPAPPMTVWTPRALLREVRIRSLALPAVSGGSGSGMGRAASFHAAPAAPGRGAPAPGIRLAAGASTGAPLRR